MRSVQDRIERILSIRKEVMKQLPEEDSEEAIATYVLAFIQEEAAEILEKAIETVDCSR